MDLQDMTTLITAYDATQQLRSVGGTLFGHEYGVALGDGIIGKLDGIVEMICRHSPVYDPSVDVGEGVFWETLDGDATAEERAKDDPDMEDKFYMNCSNTRRPQVVDADFNPITDEDEIYGGVIARVSIDFFPYSVSGHMGISASLGNVQKLADGEPLGGGRSSALSDFGGNSDSFFA